MKLNTISYMFISMIVLYLSTNTDAHGGCYWCWRWRNHCVRESTLSIVSSECSRPLSGVTIYSRNYMAIDSSSNGRYRIRTCSLPLYVTLKKYGFRTRRVIVRYSTEKFTMRCLGSEGKTVFATVRSDCTGPLEDVQFTSTELIGVTSNVPGSYSLRVCALPTYITSKKDGYEPVTQRVSRTSMSVQMTCPASTCDAIKKIISIVSSDCLTPISDVSITSQQPISVRSLAGGSYELSVCSLPVIVSLAKSGFIDIAVKLTSSSNKIPLSCLGRTCTTETVTVTVTSDCTPAVLGVTFTSSDIIETSSSAPGTYEIMVCSLPFNIKLERTGYIPVTQAITNSHTTVSLTCIAPPLIIEHPQSKLRDLGDNVTMCCQAGPASASVSYKWFKDGTELQGETNNELTLTSLTPNDDGRYKCLAKSTASDTLPAAVSAEAHLSVTDLDKNHVRKAYVHHIVNFPPGCTLNVNRCESMSCNRLPTETCSDLLVVCASITELRSIPCSGINYDVLYTYGCACECPAQPTVLINGLVVGSDTGAPLVGVNVILNGQTDSYLTDVNGAFTFSVSTTVRRLVLKATGSNNNYTDTFYVSDILEGYTDTIYVTIVMVRKAPFIQIDPTQVNELAISGSPADQNTGVASINIPANLFFNSDLTPYTGHVSVSLTFLDPLDSDMLAIMPGRFVTLDSNGEETTLVTQGVFSLSFEDDLGNELIINGEIDVSGKPGFALYEFEPLTATWMEIKANPGRKRRQITQQQYLGSFNPQSVSWFNIDSRLLEPDCFFKVRIFEGNIDPYNEIISGFRFVPEVSQLLANGTELVNYYSYPSSSPCINIKCPDVIAQATIRISGLESVYGQAELQALLLPANISDYNTALRSVLETSPYFYSVFENETSTLFVNTPMNESGPFYLTEQTCLDATINDFAFWFIKESSHVESNFDDDLQGRCAVKIRILYWQVPLFNASVFSSINFTAVSSWSDSQYTISTTGIYFVDYGNYNEVNYETCFEYRCSHVDGSFNDTTTITLGSSEDSLSCILGWSTNVVPILDPNDLPTGFFYSNTTNPQFAIDECLSSGNNYGGTYYCNYIP